MLELHSISKRFGQNLVLKDISVTFKPKSITLLGGANGSGKSTLLKIMAGLIKPSSGQITHSAHFEESSKRLAYVGHATFIYPNLTALENLRFWQNCYHLDLSIDDLEDLLSQFGLEPFMDSYPRIFSRGMQQKLSLARAFMLRPAICLLDEPNTGLDQASQEFCQQKLLELKESGSCIVCISHSIASDQKIADQIYTLQKGELNPFHFSQTNAKNEHLVSQGSKRLCAE